MARKRMIRKRRDKDKRRKNRIRAYKLKALGITAVWLGLCGFWSYRIITDDTLYYYMEKGYNRLSEWHNESSKIRLGIVNSNDLRVDPDNPNISRGKAERVYRVFEDAIDAIFVYNGRDEDGIKRFIVDFDGQYKIKAELDTPYPEDIEGNFRFGENVSIEPGTYKISMTIEDVLENKKSDFVYVKILNPRVPKKINKNLRSYRT